MHMSLTEFETKFFDPKRVSTYLENRQKWVEQFKKADKEQKWTTAFMLLGTLAAAGRLTSAEFEAEGAARYRAGDEPSAERLYTLTALLDILK